MAYASKYYDPVKAHNYYMLNRELKGYEDRYGGSRGDGTSAASNGGKPINKTKTPEEKRADDIKKHNDKIQNKVSQRQTEVRKQIQELRNRLNAMSPEDRKLNRDSIQKQIDLIRQNSQDEIQSLREQTKGGSTSGFNQKGRDAAAYIKDQIEKERDEVIKKTNKDTDKEMLSSVKRLAEDIKAMRSSGRGFSHKQFAAKIKAMLGETKKKKLKAKKKHTSDYKQKYQDEIDKLRQDKSMYDYYDKKREREQNKLRSTQ